MNIKQLKAYLKMIMCVALLFGVIALCATDRRKRLYCLLSFIAFVFVLALVALDGTVKNRVFLSSLAATVGASFFYLEQLKLHNRVSWICFTTLCLTLSFISLKYVKQSVGYRNFTSYIDSEFDSQMQLLDAVKSEIDCFIPFAADFALEGLNPFEIKDFQYKLIGSGWSTNSPLVTPLFASHKDIVTKGIPIFISCEYVGFTEHIQQGLKDNYGIGTEVQTVAADGRYCIVRIVEK